LLYPLAKNPTRFAFIFAPAPISIRLFKVEHRTAILSYEVKPEVMVPVVVLEGDGSGGTDTLGYFDLAPLVLPWDRHADLARV